MILAGLGGFAAFLALLDGSYAQAAASALVALLLCPFAAPMLLSLAGSAMIVAASALFAWLSNKNVQNRPESEQFREMLGVLLFSKVNLQKQARARK